MIPNPLSTYYCYPICTISQYRDSSQICQSCDLANCTSCSGNPTFCTSCLGFELKPFKYLLNNSCVTDCGEKYFKDDNLKICQSCHQSCLTCSTAQFNNCLRCDKIGSTPYFLNGQCLATCPNNMISDPINFICIACPSNCSACNNGGCTGCLNGQQPVNGVCSNLCPSGQYFGGNGCFSCNSLCTDCQNSADNCLSCPSGYILSQQNTCLIVCKEGETWVPPNNCESCDSACDFCSVGTKDCNIYLRF